MKSILVTGSNGLLGKEVVDTLLNEGYSVTGISTGEESKCKNERFKYISADLTNFMEVDVIFKENQFSHIIHLAAIAHVLKGLNITWSRYYRVNTMMSRKIFECADADKIPVFFASSIDIYGMTSDLINEGSEAKPIGDYAKSKYLAERSMMEIVKHHYLIARFAPIYSETDLRDVHRRYYLKYPKLCYLIGNGMEYEFLSSRNAVNLILTWVKSPETITGIINVSDSQRHNTRELIEIDRQNGLAHRVLWFPNWTKGLARVGVNMVFRKNPLYKFSAYKIIEPIRLDHARLDNI